MAEQRDKIIGGFKVLQEIQVGAGSQGTVYKAVCEEDKHGLVPVGTLVALKVMAVQDEGGVQWRKLQKRTAELVRLDHPNVVKYYGCFSEQGLFNDVHVVVQEFLHGETLKERLARQSTGLDVDEGVKVVDLTLAGLEYTTGCGIVHRDLKPGNIFLCDGGGVKLIDFEIAKQEGGTATASVGNIRGSFDYMAPDFTNPEFHGDVQSDVFSMGVVLHEVL
ncbi:MAG: serine/threonine protein kinase, partial [Kiritimatiellae bacterium]|nr:serine/threonine protein kinase [Kiritimatiellia bacterium]